MFDRPDIEPHNFMTENDDYELIPGDEEDTWNIRILKGDFVETVIRFNTVRFDDEGWLRYSFDIILSPDSELTTENSDLQSIAGEILLSVIQSATEKENNGHDGKTYSTKHPSE
jgi:hypothetical protein